MRMTGPLPLRSRRFNASSNNVFIDDMGWADFSRFENKDALTTNFEEMAAEGIALEQFYVNSPIFSPVRAGLLENSQGLPLEWLCRGDGRKQAGPPGGLCHSWFDGGELGG